ncbi:MAG TPA: hypothetical protein VE990_04135 [Acidimicrobiales bacterium]|nr:hypothetical protein [Acidimicrobiales bacterium]
MARFLLRIWLTDRPGALGSVASRIGAVRGDVVGIDILERNAGMAVDELAVDLPGADLVDLMVREIQQVDGVKVEDVRPVEGGADRLTFELEAAVDIVEAPDSDEVLEALCRSASELTQAPWSAVLCVENQELLACRGGPLPPLQWLTAVALGLGSAPGASVDGMVVAELTRSRLVFLVGGSGLTVRQRERESLVHLARVADLQWSRLACLAATAEHPSRRRMRPVAI